MMKFYEKTFVRFFIKIHAKFLYIFKMIHLKVYILKALYRVLSGFV